MTALGSRSKSAHPVVRLPRPPATLVDNLPPQPPAFPLVGSWGTALPQPPQLWTAVPGGSGAAAPPSWGSEGGRCPRRPQGRPAALAGQAWGPESLQEARARGSPGAADGRLSSVPLLQAFPTRTQAEGTSGTGAGRGLALCIPAGQSSWDLVPTQGRAGRSWACMWAQGCLEAKNQELREHPRPNTEGLSSASSWPSWELDG